MHGFASIAAYSLRFRVHWFGERIGNANLCAVLPNLVLKEGVECAAGERLAELTGLSRAIEAMANLVPDPRLPYVGAAAFAHKGGVQVHAVAAAPRTYEHVDPMRLKPLADAVGGLALNSQGQP